MRSMSIPSSAEAIMDQDVSWPWPCGDVPVKTVAVPSPLMTTRATSSGSEPGRDWPVIST